MKPASPEAYSLLMDGAIALAEVESNGMRVDLDYVDRATVRTQKRIDRIANDELMGTEVVKKGKRMFGASFKLSSDLQLSRVLFGKMGYKAGGVTLGGRESMNEESLEGIDDPFIEPYLRYKRLSKVANTFLKSVRREVVDGYAHCFFNLHTTVSYRSSSEAFNFQNLPMRDEESMTIVRQAFVPRPGRRIVEFDFSGMEVRVAACYHKDPTMIQYITDPSKDMHRDMAQEIYKLPAAEVTKGTRNAAKGPFVFAQFYGSHYADCARSLWKWVDRQRLTLVNGKPLRQHLIENRLTELGDLEGRDGPAKGTFGAHVREITRAFWEERFPVYDQWKKDWYAAYQKRGYLRTLTGFVCQGYMRRNQVINLPVQGSAFHLLLWSLIRLIRDEMPKRRMKSLIVGQIHDSIVADVVESELDEFLSLCRRVTTKKVRAYAPWLAVPMATEVEVSPPGESWAAKKKYEVE